MNDSALDEQQIRELSHSILSETTLPEQTSVLLWEENHFVNPDGSFTSYHRQLIRIGSDDSKFKNVWLPYNELREGLTLRQVSLLKTNGDFIEKKISDFTVENYLEDTPVFKNLSALYSFFSGLASGDLLYFDYVRQVRIPLMENIYNTFFELPAGLKTYTAKLTINLPIESKPRFLSTFVGNIEPRRLSRGSRQVLQWQIAETDLSEFSKPGAIASAAPMIVVSTLESWDELVQWYQPLFEGAVKESSPAIREKAAALLVEIPHHSESHIEALHRFVSREIETIPLRLDQTGWFPLSAAFVLESGYGDSAAKAALLTALLRESGFQAYGALVQPLDRRFLFEDLPSFNFSQLLVAVKLDGAILFLDPTEENLPFNRLPPALHDRPALILQPGEAVFERTPALDLKSNAIQCLDHWDLKEEENHAVKMDCEWTGFSAAAMRPLIAADDTLFRNLFEKDIQRLYPSAEIKEMQISNGHLSSPLRVHTEIEIPPETDATPNLTIWKPKLLLNEGFLKLTEDDVRQYPLYLGMTEVLLWEASVVYPESWSAQLPATISLVESFGSYERTVTSDGPTRLRVLARLTLSSLVIPPELYPAFKAFIQKIVEVEKETVRFVTSADNVVSETL